MTQDFDEPGDAVDGTGDQAVATEQLAPEDLATELARYNHGRVPRDLRHRQVIAEAEALFTERGFHGASMDELAQRVGVSKPVIYDLVGSKEQLFHEIMTRVADDLAAAITDAVAAEPDPELGLYAGSLAFFTFVRDHRAAWDALLQGDAAPVTTAVAAIRHRQTDLVVELLTAGAGRLGVQVDALQIEAAAHAINGANESLAAWWLDHEELSPEDLTALVTVLVAPGLEALSQGGFPR